MLSEHEKIISSYPRALLLVASLQTKQVGPHLDKEVIFKYFWNMYSTL